MNALINGRRASFARGDLYEPCHGQYDMITANPPFVPTPEQNSELFRSGGLARLSQELLILPRPNSHEFAAGGQALTPV
ncbi:hypothetical protein IV102_23485 [bacterium]|nr:hypothetical protein [bacterium]